MMLAFPVPMEKISDTIGRQLTKYINQCKEKDMTLKNATRKLLAIGQGRRNAEPPPPVPQVDYKWLPGDEDGWISDFEDDDGVTDTAPFENGALTQYHGNSATFPVTHNDEQNSSIDETWSCQEVQPHDEQPLTFVARTVQLPPQPDIPRWKLKPTDVNSLSATESSVSPTRSPTDPQKGKPLRPIIPPRPISVVSSTASHTGSQLNLHNGTSLPRPPNSLPLMPTTNRGSIQRPTQQPPPPPVAKPQLPDLQLSNDLAWTSDEYEIPNAELTSLSVHSSVSMSSSAQRRISSGSQWSSGSSSASTVSSASDCQRSSSGSTSTNSERPILPPRMVFTPGGKPSLIPPALPKKPANISVSPSESTPAPPSIIRPMEKTVPLPTRIVKTDENGNKIKDAPRLIAGAVTSITNKLATFLSPERGPKSDSSSTSQDGSSRVDSMCSTPERHGSCTSLASNEPPSISTMQGRTLQDIPSKTSTPKSSPRHSVDETASVQSRPLPPVPVAKSPTDHLNSIITPATTPECIKETLDHFVWFHLLERDESEQALKQLSKSGSYLVRESRRAGECNPFTLSVLYEGRVFHLNIRRRTDYKYALGKDKPGEKIFASVEQLITNHQMEPIILTAKGVAAGKTSLLFTPEKR